MWWVGCRLHQHSWHPAHDAPSYFVRIWFQNDAQRIGQSQRCSHAASTPLWTSKAVCGTLYTEQVSEVQCHLSGGGNTRSYSRALGENFGGLSEVEAKLSITPAELWNADASSGQFPCRYVATIGCVSPFLTFPSCKTKRQSGV